MKIQSLLILLLITLDSSKFVGKEVLTHYMFDKINQGSLIRIMSEKAQSMAKKHGADKIHNFSMGSPTIPPPKEYIDALIETANDNSPGVHDYASTMGLEKTREKFAELMQGMQNVKVTKDEVVLTSGCAAAINIFLKSVVKEDDEVIIVAPYFSEYILDIENWKAKPVVLKTKFEENFQVNVKELEKLITIKTRVLLLNSPNNPTGITYSQNLIKEISELLTKKSIENNRIIYLLSDDVYSRIIFGNKEHVKVFPEYEYSVVTYSLSKDLSIPGERIGAAIVNPSMPEKEKLVKAMGFNNDAVGICNANIFQMRVVQKVIPKKAQVELYEKSADIICKILDEENIKYVRPQGAFYVFPKIPDGIEEMKFCDILANNFIIVVPGSAFGMEGFFRMAYGKPPEDVEKAMPFLRQGIKEAKKVIAGNLRK